MSTTSDMSAKIYLKRRGKKFSKDFWESRVMETLPHSSVHGWKFSVPKEYQLTNGHSHKEESVFLKLIDNRVCKLFLLKTLDISQKRYNNVLKST